MQAIQCTLSVKVLRSERTTDFNIEMQEVLLHRKRILKGPNCCILWGVSEHFELIIL